jgi:hypothetical protein
MEKNHSPTITALCDALNRLPRGRLDGQHASIVLQLLMRAWDDLGGSGRENTVADTLSLWENPRWESPCLFFEVERHERCINGSTRADLHYWEVDTWHGSAYIQHFGWRQMTAMDPPFHVKPVAAACWRCIQSHIEHPGLRWSKDGLSVSLKIDEWIPKRCQQTTVARKKRFMRELASLMQGQGWRLERSGNRWTVRRCQDVVPQPAATDG